MVVPHHAAFVIEAVLEQQLDRMRAQVPRRGAVAAGVAARELLDLLVRARELRFLLFAREARGRHVRPALVSDLVAGLHDAGAALRVGFQRMPGGKPGGGDAVLLGQRTLASSPRWAVCAHLGAGHSGGAWRRGGKPQPRDGLPDWGGAAAPGFSRGPCGEGGAGAPPRAAPPVPGETPRPPGAPPRRRWEA